MIYDRKKLFNEIAGLASLISHYPVQYQSHIVECAADFLNDASRKSYGRGRAYKEVKPGALKIRETELASFDGLKLNDPLMAVLAPMVERSPEIVDTILTMLCAELQHRRLWDDVEKRHLHTREFLRSLVVK